MIDPFVLLTPLLVLGILALVRFVGCFIKPSRPDAGGPITFQQLSEADQISNNDNISTPAFLNAVASGNLMVVWIWYHSGVESVSVVTDTANNTYQRAVGPTPGLPSFPNRSQEIWYAKNISPGANLIVTATFSGTFNDKKAISAHEYSGANQNDPVDVTNGMPVVNAAHGSSVAASTGTPITTDARLIFGAALFAGTGTSTSDFMQRSSSSGNVTEDKQITSSGSYAATFTVTSGTPDWIAQMVAFK